MADACPVLAEQRVVLGCRCTEASQHAPGMAGQGRESAARRHGSSGGQRRMSPRLVTCLLRGTQPRRLPAEQTGPTKGSAVVPRGGQAEGKRGRSSRGPVGRLEGPQSRLRASGPHHQQGTRSGSPPPRGPRTTEGAANRGESRPGAFSAPPGSPRAKPHAQGWKGAP